MISILTSFFLLAGAFFILLSSIGVLRFPDLYSRMHAVTKATSFGIFLLLIATSIYFREISTIIKSILVVMFIYLTAPISAHAVAKSHREKKDLVDKDK